MNTLTKLFALISILVIFVGCDGIDNATQLADVGLQIESHRPIGDCSYGFNEHLKDLKLGWDVLFAEVEARDKETISEILYAFVILIRDYEDAALRYEGYRCNLNSVTLDDYTGSNIVEDVIAPRKDYLIRYYNELQLSISTQDNL